MESLKGLTINTAPEAEPHIYAEDDAAIYQSIVGSDGVFNIGQKLKATVLSNNKVRIADGVICVGGHFARIPYGAYGDVTIMNGVSGKNRNDIIAVKFESTGSGGIDTFSLEVVQGTAGTVAVDPVLTQDDLYNAGRVREMPLYRVKIEGLSIVEAQQMFEVIPTIPEIEKKTDELCTDISYDSEIETGQTYRGKPVFLKIISIGALPNNGTMAYVTGIPAATDIWIDQSLSHLILATGNSPIPWIDTNGYFIRAVINRSTRNIEITDNWNYSQFSAKIAVKYTKA